MNPKQNAFDKLHYSPAVGELSQNVLLTPPPPPNTTKSLLSASEMEQHQRIEKVYSIFAEAVDFSHILNNISATLERAAQFKSQEGV